MLSLIVIITVLSQASSSQTNELACPEGWERLDSKCYQIVTGKPKTWALARQDCNENGGKLFLPMDKIENNGIYDLYNQRANKIERFWIDVAALDQNSPLLYTTGEGQELSYINWRPNEPNSPNTCGIMVESFGLPYLWADIACNSLYDYVCEKTLKSFKKGTCPFEDNVLFVETSIQKESIEDCQEFCQEIANCEFFTWNQGSQGCGIRTFSPSNYIRANGQKSATRNGEVLNDGLVLVGKALKSRDRETCLKTCQADDKCFSCTYNDETSDNPNICVLNYGPIQRKLPLGPDSGVSSAPKDC